MSLTSLVCPYLHYCNLAWASTYVSNLKWLILLQKQIVRSIERAEDYLASSEPIFKKLEALKVTEINSLQKGIFMFSYCNHLLPACFNDLFISGSQVHCHHTRSANNLRSHCCRTTLKLLSITHQGPLLWNSLDDSLTYLSSLSKFKTIFKAVFLKAYSSD